MCVSYAVFHICLGSVAIAALTTTHSLLYFRSFSQICLLFTLFSLFQHIEVTLETHAKVYLVAQYDWIEPFYLPSKRAAFGIN